MSAKIPIHQRVERQRGRKAVATRDRRLRAEPLCRMCRAKGIIRAATTPDHITPLAFGGTDTEGNIQCLCQMHHDEKTAFEAAHKQAAAHHPLWMPRSAIPVTIVSGPPASGKSTHVETHAGQDDTIIDLDGIMARIKPGYKHWQGMLDSALLNGAIRVRNEMLAQLCRRTSGVAWFIVSAPTQAERDWWQSKLGGQVLLLDPGVDECKRRATQRGTPKALDGIDQWYRSSRSVWAAPKPKPARQRIAADGWPIES